MKRGNYIATSVPNHPRKKAPLVDKFLIYCINVPYRFHFAATIFMIRVTVLNIRPKVSDKPTVSGTKETRNYSSIYTTDSYAAFLAAKQSDNAGTRTQGSLSMSPARPWIARAVLGYAWSTAQPGHTSITSPPPGGRRGGRGVPRSMLLTMIFVMLTTSAPPTADQKPAT